MARSAVEALRDLARSAIALDGVRSAAIFAARPDSSDLELAAAAGIEGPPLDALVAAVRNPAHPIARTLAEASASYDVIPTAPGGPALRSHLPLVARDGSLRAVNGVLAVAHDRPLDPDARRALEAIAVEASAAIADARADADRPGPGTPPR